MTEVICKYCGVNYKTEEEMHECPALMPSQVVGVVRAEPSALSQQTGVNHYKDFPIQPVEFCQKNNIRYCEANVIKYVCRHRDKNGLEDLKKAKHYIDLLIELEYGED